MRDDCQNCIEEVSGILRANIVTCLQAIPLEKVEQAIRRHWPTAPAVHPEVQPILDRYRKHLEAIKTDATFKDSPYWRADWFSLGGGLLDKEAISEDEAALARVYARCQPPAVSPLISQSDWQFIRSVLDQGIVRCDGPAAWMADVNKAREILGKIEGQQIAAKGSCPKCGGSLDANGNCSYCEDDFATGDKAAPAVHPEVQPILDRYRKHLEASQTDATFKDSPYYRPMEYAQGLAWDEEAISEDEAALARIYATAGVAAAPAVELSDETASILADPDMMAAIKAGEGEQAIPWEDAKRELGLEPSEATALADWWITMIPFADALGDKRFNEKITKTVAMLSRQAIDSGNYRAKCGLCETANMDMLTDDYCAQCEVERLRTSHAEMVRRLGKTHEALVKLWKHTPKIDNGRCMVCRIGYANWESDGKDLLHVGKCSCDDCLSHVVTKAILAESAPSGPPAKETTP